MTREQRFNNLIDFLDYRVDIIANNPNRWLYSFANKERPTSYHNLPTFEYYLKNCVIDKGGKYDFTKRLHNISYWMGTPFNFKTVVQ